MYEVQTTPGLIIDSRPHGEAGKILYIFTRDLGLVRAAAQGIRLEKSKLRYQTQNYSFGIFSMVRGKEYWRLVGAQEANNADNVTQQQKESLLAIMAPTALLLRRLLQGEQAHPELFLCLEKCRDFITILPELSDERMKTLESVTVIRILHRLGYVGDGPFLNGELKEGEFTVELLDLLASKRTEINKNINKALKESHL